MMTPNAATRDAIVCILMMAKISDGQVKPREDEAFLSSLKRARSLAGLSESELRAIEARVASGLSDATLAEAARHIPEELRLPLFAQALDILLADGEISEAEADFINGLIFQLNINSSEVEPVIEVLTLKNRL
jgi:uncharacterized tellurite resistance protein B-like protein